MGLQYYLRKSTDIGEGGGEMPERQIEKRQEM